LAQVVREEGIFPDIDAQRLRQGALFQSNSITMKISSSSGFCGRISGGRHLDSLGGYSKLEP